MSPNESLIADAEKGNLDSNRVEKITLKRKPVAETGFIFRLWLNSIWRMEVKVTFDTT